MTTTTQQFNIARQFGVEIEFLATSHELSKLIVAIRANGVSVEQESYNHTTRNNWKIITDASCGWELVSPILKGRNGLEQIKNVCSALNTVGIKVDKNCGFHVHHDCNNMNVTQLANIFAVYAKLEKTFDSLLPMSRRSNRFCKSLLTQGEYSTMTHEELFAKLASAKTVNDMSNLFNNRYRKVNFQSYLKYGTVEFRQHSGTTDYAKMYNWILLTQQVVEKAMGKVKYTYEAQYDNLQGMRNVLRLIEAKGATEEIANVFKYERKRAADFANASN